MSSISQDVPPALRPVSMRSARARRIDLRSLDVFVAVADTGSMTIAAGKLGMTQPAVSQVVRQLEKDFGSALFDRDLRPLRLKPAGVVLINRARKLLSDADRLCAEVRDTESSVLPRLRVGLVDSFAAVIGSVIAASLKTEVEQLLVRSGVSQDLRAALIDRELDMIVSSDALEDVAEIERRRLLRESYVVIAPDTLKLRSEAPSLAELAATLPLIRLSPRTLMGAQVDRHLGWLRIDAPRRTEFDSVDTVAATVADGGGWAILPPLSLARASAWLPRITTLPLPGPPLARSLYLAKRDGEYAGIADIVAERSSAMLRAKLAAKLDPLPPWVIELVRIT